MRNPIVQLPDGYLPVACWAPHPCGGYFVEDAVVYPRLPCGVLARYVSG